MSPANKELLAGLGKRTINAPVGTIMDGLRKSGGTTGCHDDLFVRVLWLQQGERRVVLVNVDLIYAERLLVDQLKGAISRRFGLAAHEILINFSHTHAPPCFCHWSYGGPPDPIYVDKVENAIIEAFDEARTSLRMSRLFAGSTTTGLPVSRRRPNETGEIEFRPYPPGEICEALPFFFLKDDKDAVLALIFSVSCHPSIIHLHDTSADYPGAAIAIMNKRLATEGSLFLQGTGGDAKPRQIVAEGDKWKQGDWDDMEAAGQQVADELSAGIEAATEIRPDLRTFLHDIEFPLQSAPGRDELSAIDDPRRKPWAKDMLRRLEWSGELPDRIPIALHAVSLGQGLRLIALEAEVTAPLGNLILRHYPDEATFPLGYTNGTQLYLPSDKQLAEGGYESTSAWEYHWPANLEPGIDARLEKALCKADEVLGS